MRHEMIVEEPSVDGALNCLVGADQAGDPLHPFGAGKELLDESGNAELRPDGLVQAIVVGLVERRIESISLQGLLDVIGGKASAAQGIGNALARNRIHQRSCVAGEQEMIS